MEVCNKLDKVLAWEISIFQSEVSSVHTCVSPRKCLE